MQFANVASEDFWRFAKSRRDWNRVRYARPLSKLEHSGDDFEIKCKILALEDQISARKALEASYILARDPKMNGKNEKLSITSDLLPYLALCELWDCHYLSHLIAIQLLIRQVTRARPEAAYAAATVIHSVGRLSRPVSQSPPETNRIRGCEEVLAAGKVISEWLTPFQASEDDV